MSSSVGILFRLLFLQKSTSGLVGLQRTSWHVLSGSSPEDQWHSMAREPAEAGSATNSGINPPPGGTHKWALCFHLSQRSLPDRHLTYVHRHPWIGTCWIQHCSQSLKFRAMTEPGKHPPGFLALTTSSYSFKKSTRSVKRGSLDFLGLSFTHFTYD